MHTAFGNERRRYSDVLLTNRLCSPTMRSRIVGADARIGNRLAQHRRVDNRLATRVVGPLLVGSSFTPRS